MAILAINGGKKICKKPFADQITYGQSETDAVQEHMMSRKLLSGYRGNWIPAFWGGPEVRKFEDAWSEFFNVPFCLAVNSCTSALQIACHAVGIKPGDEVIVTPWSMSCSATAPMVCGATPVFADIEPEQFCLSYESICEKITKRTKAIIIVSLFGSPVDSRIYDLAKEKGIFVIEDCAQAPGAGYINVQCEIQFSGHNADIACFSFTQGKHLTCGEGGLIMTSNEALAMRCAAIRNHSESVVSAMDDENHALKYNIFNDIYFQYIPGYNMRMTELNAVIMQKQLKKLDVYMLSRNEAAEEIYTALSDIPFIKKPAQRKNTRHAYYCQPFLYDNETAPVHRDIFIKTVAAELMGEVSRPDRPMLGCGYIKPLYRMPIFDSDNGLPVVERLWKKDFFLSMYHNLPLDYDDIIVIRDAFHKVADNVKELENTMSRSYWRNV
jgi:dTDP-4-amino-4,6-dideoxygalactose transaminase